MKVMGIACMTNKNLPDCMAETTHEDVIEQASNHLQQCLRLFVRLSPVWIKSGTNLVIILTM